MRQLVLVLVFVGACASAHDGESKPVPAHDVVSGAGRIRGGGFRMDVEIGHITRPTKTSNGTVTAKPASAVIP
jgi:hypothetical protein